MCVCGEGGPFQHKSFYEVMILLLEYRMEQKTLVYSTGTGLAEISGSDVLMTDMFTCMWECGIIISTIQFTIEPLPSLFRHSVVCQSRTDVV